MKHKISLPKSELVKIQEECKLQGFDYNETTLNATYDTVGNIIKITLGIPEHLDTFYVKTVNKKQIFETKLFPAILPNKKLVIILQSHGFE